MNGQDHLEVDIHLEVHLDHHEAGRRRGTRGWPHRCPNLSAAQAHPRVFHGNQRRRLAALLEVVFRRS